MCSQLCSTVYGTDEHSAPAQFQIISHILKESSRQNGYNYGVSLAGQWQVELFNAIMFSKLRDYVVEEDRNWDTFCFLWNT